MNIQASSHLNTEANSVELARRRADSKIKRKILELIIILAFGLVIVHEFTHILTAYLIGFDITGWYFYVDFPYVRWHIPNAPSVVAAPFEWFIVRLSGPLLEGIFFTIISIKKENHHILFLAVYAFVYGIFESMNLLLGIYTVFLSLLLLVMTVLSYLSMEKSIDQLELSRITSDIS